MTAYLPLVSDSGNAWITLFKGIATQYAPSLPWDGNVLYGLASAYTFVQALKAAGQNPTRADIVKAVENGHFSGPGSRLVRLLVEQPPRLQRGADRHCRHQRDGHLHGRADDH